jgi:adenylylsulfate kinase
MPQHSQHRTWDTWPGWSIISAHESSSFTLWLTGLPGTGKTTIAHLVKKALVARGYKVEIIDAHTLSRWLNLALALNEEIREDCSHTIGYDAFTTYICTLLAHNGISSISTAVSPFAQARAYAREQIQQFIEVFLHCSNEQREERLLQQEHLPTVPVHLYQPPIRAELSIDTDSEPAERSALRVINYLEQYGYIAPRWEEVTGDEEIARIKARLQALGYLE